jgi:hypothetical protein
MQVRSSFIYLIAQTQHKNKILNRYHMSEINYFKILLLYEIMWQMI